MQGEILFKKVIDKYVYLCYNSNREKEFISHNASIDRTGRRIYNAELG